MTNKSRIMIILSLMLCLVLSLSGLSLAQPSDIKSHWAEKQISNWESNGLVQGYPDGTFKPDNSVSRAEFIAMVNRTFDYTDSVSVNYTDVSQADWFAGEISKAKAAGYVTGYEDHTIRPHHSVSRQEVAVILVRILKLDITTDNINQFKDATSISVWSKGAIGVIADQGIMTGYPDQTYQPLKPITRAEAVIVLDRALKAVLPTITYDKAGVYGPTTGVETIDGNVSITTTRVTLQNLKISGNLFLAESIGEGDVTLKNVTVEGKTTIKGGGSHSIILENCHLPSVTVNKAGVRVVAAGKTIVNAVRLDTGATLVEEDLTDNGFENVTINETLPVDAPVTLNGNFTKVNVNAKACFEISNGTVAILEVSPKATGATIDIADNAKVTTLIFDAAVSVTGKGTIETAKVNVSGSTVEQQPENLEKQDGVSVDIGTSPVGTGSGKTSGTDSGDGGGVKQIVFEGVEYYNQKESLVNEDEIPGMPIIKLSFSNGLRDNYLKGVHNELKITLHEGSASGAIVEADVYMKDPPANEDEEDTEKRSMYLMPQTTLAAGEKYALFIDGSFTANNGKTLGQTQTVIFQVKASAGNSGGSSQESDTTPPIFAIDYPQVTGVQATQFSLAAQTNEAGQAYYVVLADGATAPTAAEVKAGTGQGGGAAIRSGQISLTKNTPASTAITGLSPVTAYDVYVVAQDNVSNVQGSPVKVEVTTGNADIPTVPSNPATAASFTDTDGDAGQIGGVIEWALAVSEEGIDGYNVYFVDESNNPIGDPLGMAAAGVGSYTIASDTTVPDGAVKLGVYSYNSNGNCATGTFVPVIPAFQSAEVSSKGDISIIFDINIAGTANSTLPLFDTVNYNEQFTVNVDGNLYTVTQVELTNTPNKIKLVLETKIKGGQAVTVAYTRDNDPAKQIFTAGGGEILTSFTAKEVTNTLPVLTTENAAVSEADTNDGSIAATLVITLNNGTFVADISAGVTAASLPEGLGINVIRDSDTQITIAFTGKATNHTQADSIGDANIMVSKSIVIDAKVDLLPLTFATNFAD